MNIYLDALCLICTLFLVLDWWRLWFRDRRIERKIRSMWAFAKEAHPMYGGAVRDIAYVLGIKLEKS